MAPGIGMINQVGLVRAYCASRIRLDLHPIDIMGSLLFRAVIVGNSNIEQIPFPACSSISTDMIAGKYNHPSRPAG